MGVGTVAVYSDVDRGALHVLHADEAYRLGPAPAAESYLRGDLILEVAGQAGADAVHPGYGFLSENAEFAEACAAAGVTFIGPPASAMRVLGSKTRARQAADAAAMPRVPGSVTGLADVAEAVRVAAGIGYPVMLKAAAGGGGKGMRAVTKADPSVMLERATRVRQPQSIHTETGWEVFPQALTDLSAAMREPSLRFFAVDHVAMMFAAVVLVHVGRALARKAAGVDQKRKRLLICFGLAVFAMLACIPWPGMPSGRPFFRV